MSLAKDILVSIGEELKPGQRIQSKKFGEVEFLGYEDKGTLGRFVQVKDKKGVKISIPDKEALDYVDVK